MSDNWDRSIRDFETLDDYHEWREERFNAAKTDQAATEAILRECLAEERESFDEACELVNEMREEFTSLHNMTAELRAENERFRALLANHGVSAAVLQAHERALSDASRLLLECRGLEETIERLRALLAEVVDDDATEDWFTPTANPVLMSWLRRIRAELEKK